MISIPEELLEQFERDNVIPLIGRGINRGLLPRAAELARQLTKRCNYPPGEPETLRHVAGYYELTTRDRHGLIDFLKNQLDKPQLEPTRSHRLIAQLRPRIVVTVCYDRLLERAFREEGVPYAQVVGNEEVAYSDERKTLLVWLWGVIDRPDSLIVTEDDHRRFLDGRENLSDVLRGELGRRTWLFLGADPGDAWFRSYYDGATRTLDRHRRRSYIVGTALSEYARAWWAERAQIFETDIETFLSELTNQLAARQQPAAPEPVSVPRIPAEPVNLPLPERPYKLLDFYEAKDAPIFFGREAERQRLSSLIHAHRMVLFYGASGAGKTSLLLAGVAPRLEEADPEYKIVYLRVMDSPVDIIRRTVRRRLPEVELPDDSSLVDFLDAAANAANRTLVIVLDQFEEFFIRFSPHAREAFIAELGALYDARDVPVKIVLSLREDWLASLNELKERIPEVFYIGLRLLPLTREQAHQAITGPAGKLGVSYDTALVDRLLKDLMDEAVVGDDGFVDPPQLQLVCDAVYEHARANGRQRITLADYESVGGAEGILDRYIEAALHEHPGDEREVARNVLIALVTSHEMKAKQDLEGLATELGEDKAEVEQVLTHLTGQRLVRRLEEGHTYELAHDILAATIATWLDEEQRQVKQVRELLRRELVDWQEDPSALPSLGKYRRIMATRDALHFTEEEAGLLLRAALFYDEDIPYWLDQVNESDTEIEILLEMLESDDYQARLTSARVLANYQQDGVAIALAQTTLEDPEPIVRNMGAISLGLMQGQKGIDFLTDVVLEKENPRRTRAFQALARIQDVAPDQRIELSGSTRFHIYYDLAKIRFQGDWPRIRLVTTAGAIGGALGFGFGLTLPLVPQSEQIFGPSASVLDLAFVGLFLAILGLLAGAIMAFGISGAESLKRERASIARIVGGTLLGGLGFAVALFPLAIAAPEGLIDVVLKIIGGGLFGVLTALGITVPAALTSRRIAVLIGGALGASLGIFVGGALGFELFQVQSVGTPVLIASGGATGLIMALSMTVAESRSAVEENDEKQGALDRFDHTQAIQGKMV